MFEAVMCSKMTLHFDKITATKKCTMSRLLNISVINIRSEIIGKLLV